MCPHPSGVLRQLAAVALALAILAAAASAAAPGCAPAGAKVLKASGAARVYSVGTALYGCLGSSRTLLGSLQGTPGSPAARVTRYSLASPYVGIDTLAMGVDTLTSTVSFFDLAERGPAVASVPAARPLRRPEFFVTVTALLMSRGGILAWAARSSAIGAPKPVYTLWAMTAEHEQRVAIGAAPFTDLKLYPIRHTLTWQTGDGGPIHTSPV